METTQISHNTLKTEKGFRILGKHGTDQSFLRCREAQSLAPKPSESAEGFKTPLREFHLGVESEFETQITALTDDFFANRKNPSETVGDSNLRPSPGNKFLLTA